MHSEEKKCERMVWDNSGSRRKWRVSFESWESAEFFAWENPQGELEVSAAVSCCGFTLVATQPTQTFTHTSPPEWDGEHKNI